MKILVVCGVVLLLPVMMMMMEMKILSRCGVVMMMMMKRKKKTYRYYKPIQQYSFIHIMKYFLFLLLFVTFSYAQSPWKPPGNAGNPGCAIHCSYTTSVGPPGPRGVNGTRGEKGDTWTSQFASIGLKGCGSGLTVPKAAPIPFDGIIASNANSAITETNTRGVFNIRTTGLYSFSFGVTSSCTVSLMLGSSTNAYTTTSNNQMTLIQPITAVNTTVSITNTGGGSCKVNNKNKDNNMCAFLNIIKLSE